MTFAQPRSRSERKADTLAKLQTPAMDVWVATASMADGGPAHPYLVPLSLAWVDDRVVVALEADSRTGRNIIESGTARLALGPTRDVVIIDAVLDRAVDLADAPQELAERYADQADWDPRTARGRYLFILLRPERIQAWREVNELPGRTLMRAGTWMI